MSSPEERYQNLEIKESLPRICRYPIACKELSCILRRAYDQFPKNLQSLIFQDTLTAFRLLPEIQTKAAVSAATLLSQGAEAVLPKQKKNLALSEFKHAKIAHKRRSKLLQEEKDFTQLPEDVTVQIFRFLDFRSLVSAGLVCWSWNIAANDNSLWRLLYIGIFGHGLDSQPKHKNNSRILNYVQNTLGKDSSTSKTFINWKEEFKRKCTGSISKKLLSNRGYCRHCKAIVWLNHNTCSSHHNGSKSSNISIKPVSPQQVVDYLLDEFSSSDSNSSSDNDSDSDSNGHSSSRLWAYSKILQY